MTLYDLLGALPDDDAEGLRTAFRRAVKGAHPDIRPGDPDAAFKFRRIVRAHEILGDEEQRAAYDHLLDLAHQEKVSASGRATAARIHKLASGAIALAGACIVTVGGYLLFMHMSAASVAPADNPAMHASASSPALSPVTPGKRASLPKDESADVPGGAIGPSANVAEFNSGSIPSAHAGPAPGLAGSDVRPARARGTSAHRHGNANADPGPGQASLPDPNISPASSDRTILHRLRRFERAFADVAPENQIEKQAEKPGRAKSAAAASGAPRLGPGARPPIPIPRPRTVVQDPSREESVASVRLR